MNNLHTKDTSKYSDLENGGICATIVRESDVERIREKLLLAVMALSPKEKAELLRFIEGGTP